MQRSAGHQHRVPDASGFSNSLANAMRNFDGRSRESATPWMSRITESSVLRVIDLSPNVRSCTRHNATHSIPATDLGPGCQAGGARKG